MNIFFLYFCVAKCAKAYCDRHVVKIILEITQMCWSANHLTRKNVSDEWKVPSNIKIYRKSYTKHPMTLWVATTKTNYLYTVNLGLALCKEYTHRYNKTHACQPILEFLKTFVPPCDPELKSSNEKTFYATKNLPKISEGQKCSPVPLCMPEEYHDKNLIRAYRNYYKKDKRYNIQCEWKSEDRSPPKWFLK